MTERRRRRRRTGSDVSSPPIYLSNKFWCPAKPKGTKSRLSLNIPAWLSNNPPILEKSYIKRSVITLPFVFGSGRQPWRPAGGNTQEVCPFSRATHTPECLHLEFSPCCLVTTEDVQWLRLRRRGNRIVQLIIPEMWIYSWALTGRR